MTSRASEVYTITMELEQTLLQGWRSIGATENLTSDASIASFLVALYMSTKQEDPPPGGGVPHARCSQCRSPLSLHCPACHPPPASAPLPSALLGSQSSDVYLQVLPSLESSAGLEDVEVEDSKQSLLSLIQQHEAYTMQGTVSPHSNGQGDTGAEAKSQTDSQATDTACPDTNHHHASAEHLLSLENGLRRSPRKRVSSSRFTSKEIVPKSKRKESQTQQESHAEVSEFEAPQQPRAISKARRYRVRRKGGAVSELPDEKGVILSEKQHRMCVLHLYDNDYFSRRSAEELTGLPKVKRKYIRKKRRKRASDKPNGDDQFPEAADNGGPGLDHSASMENSNQGDTQEKKASNDTKEQLANQHLQESTLEQLKELYKLSGRPKHILASAIPISKLQRESGKEKGYSWFQCVFCKLAFRLRSKFNRHILQHTDPAASVKKEEDKGTRNEIVLISMYCVKCKADRSEHKRSWEKKPPHSGQHECLFCGKLYDLAGSLNGHAYYAHSELTNKYECEHCGIKYALVRNLDKHRQEKHPQGEKLRCKKCDFTCSTYRRLKQHCKKHSRYGAQCEICGQHLSDRRCLSMHIRCHKGEKPVSCPDCGKSFRCNAQRNAHMRSYHAEVERPFRCDQCGRGFVKASNLKDHMLSHSGERPYKCSHCSATFARKDYLLKHLRIHTGEKPYICKLCGLAFIAPSTLKSHRMKVHRFELSQEAKTPSSDEEKLVIGKEEEPSQPSPQDHNSYFNLQS